MTSPTQRIWLWANSRRQWRTRRPGVLQFMGSQRVGQDLVAEQQQPKPFCYFFFNALSYLFITFFSCPLLAYMNTFFLVLHFVSLWLFKYFPCSILLNYWVWFDIQSQRKAMPKNAQTTTQLHSSHTLGRIGGRRRGDDRGWDGWMASPTRWTWVWVNSGSWWWTGKPGVLQFMGSQRVGHDWATELNWTELKEVKDLYLGNVVLRSQSGLFLSAPMRWSDP